MTFLTTSVDQILEELNPEQRASVEHCRGPLLIVAGAGTGKTTVITKKIAYLIAKKIAVPSEILALTFTDKAANEMESRVDVMVPYGYVDVSISTFHSFGDRILRDYAIDLGIRPDYKVLSHAEQVVFFREHWHEFPLKYYKSLSDPARHIEAILSIISRAKDEDISSRNYISWVKKKLSKRDKTQKQYHKEEIEEIEKQFEIACIYEKYQNLKQQKGFIDFGDQVSLVLELFYNNKSALKEFQDRYKFVLVDEFQDTNYAQFELLKLLVSSHKNLIVVGDDDQSIYKFRGASISNILTFERTYKKCKKIVLTKNYRSTQIILDTAYRLIKYNNPDRLEVKSNIDKKLYGINVDDPKKVEYKHFDTVLNEADWVARTIKDKLENKEFKLKDFAVLVRANAHAEPFCKALNMLQIPYAFSGGGGLYVFPEIKIILSFLRVIGDLSDNISLYSLAVSEIYNLSSLDMQKINTFAQRRNYTIYYVLSHIDEANNQNSEFFVLKDIKEESFDVIVNILADIEYYLDFAKNHTTGETLYQFLKRSGYAYSLTSVPSLENERKLLNISRFFEKIREFGEVVEIDTVSGFVKYLNLLKDAGEDPESAQPDIDVDAVNILTIHKAKGLEFPVVFMVSLVAERFPPRLRRDPIELPQELIKEEIPSGDFHLQEERRLFYVGITRAKEELYFTSSADYGGKRERKVSQFVLEALDLPKVDIKTYKKNGFEQIELFAPAEIIYPPINKIKKGEKISLSYYPIEDYLLCPLKYKFAHVLKIPLLPNQSIMYGSALHKAIQAYFSAKKNKQQFSKKDLIGIFLNSWSSEGFISREHEEARLNKGKESLSIFYDEQKKSKDIVRFVEGEFKFVKENIQIRGRWDLVLECVGNKGLGNERFIKIVDFKSSEINSQEVADKKARDSMQLSIYALSWHAMFGEMPDILSLVFLDSGLVGSCKKDQKSLDKTWEKIRKVSDGIRNSEFTATPSAIICNYCAYNGICPNSAV